MSEQAQDRMALVATPATLPAEPPPQLSAAALEAAPRAYSPETLRSYQRAVTSVEQRLDGRPLDDHRLSEVLAEMAAEGLGRASLAQAVAAVRWASRHSGRPDPVGPSCQVVLAAHRRHAPPPKQSPPLRWEDAEAVATIAENGGGDPAGLRDAAIISLMSDSLARVSEVSALNVEDIARRDDGSALMAIRRSKTDQEGVGVERYLGPPTVARIDAWLAAAGISDGALFRWVRGSVAMPGRLTSRSIRRIITARSADAGRVASGHSMRVGGVISLMAARESLPAIQLAGGWADPKMVSYYARGEAAAQGAIARSKYGR